MEVIVYRVVCVQRMCTCVHAQERKRDAVFAQTYTFVYRALVHKCRVITVFLVNDFQDCL